MRAIRVSFVAATILICSIAPAQAGLGLLDCLKSEKIMVPVPWSPNPVIFQPGSASQQNGMMDSIALKFIETLVSNIATGRASTPPGDSDSAKRANEILDRLDTKLDRLEQLIVNRLSKIESDVATVAKAQRDTAAQLDQRLVETTGMVHENAKNIGLIAGGIQESNKAILKTQQETADLQQDTAILLLKAGLQKQEPKQPLIPRTDNHISVNNLEGETIKGGLSIKNQSVKILRQFKYEKENYKVIRVQDKDYVTKDDIR